MIVQTVGASNEVSQQEVEPLPWNKPTIITNIPEIPADQPLEQTTQVVTTQQKLSKLQMLLNAAEEDNVLEKVVHKGKTTELQSLLTTEAYAQAATKIDVIKVSGVALEQQVNEIPICWKYRETV